MAGDVLELIAQTISDYKTLKTASEQDVLAHVEQWSAGFWKYCDDSWFGEAEHAILLEAVLAALRVGYFSEEHCSEMLDCVLEESPGDQLPPLKDPCWSWLRCPQDGGSQNELVARLGKHDVVGDGKHFVYLDDGVFSGDTLKKDLRAWLHDEAPTEAVLTTVHFFVNNDHYCKAIKELEADFERKDCRLEPNAFLFLAESLDSDSNWDDELALRLFPTQEMFESDHLASYRKRDDNARRRHVGLQLPHDVPEDDLLGGPHHRYVLTRAFLEVGAKLIMQVRQPAWRLAPLGYTDRPSLGLGALVATFRNCPNNAPMALWYEVPGKDLWHPLLPRHDKPIA